MIRSRHEGATFVPRFDLSNMKLIDHIPDEVDERDRLKRPWAVMLFTFLISIAVVVVLAARDGGIDQLIQNRGWIGVSVFAGFALVLSIVYALIGSKISVALAKKVVGAVGGLVVLARLIFLVYIVHAYSS